MDLVECKLCGKHFQVLNSHLTFTHGMLPSQYLRMFPNAQIRTPEFVAHHKCRVNAAMIHTHEKTSIAQRKRFASSEERERTAEKTRRWWASRTEEEKWNHLNSSFCSPATREKFRQIHKRMTPEERDEWVNRSFCSAKSRKACALRPTNPEKIVDRILQKYFPNTFKYNGDFSQGVMLNRLVPDFIDCNGAKKCIEVFGDYFHSDGFITKWNRGELGRIMAYNSLGFDCLILWEKDIYNKSEDELVDIIGKFIKKRQKHYAAK